MLVPLELPVPKIVPITSRTMFRITYTQLSELLVGMLINSPYNISNILWSPSKGSPQNNLSMLQQTRGCNPLSGAFNCQLYFVVSPKGRITISRTVICMSLNSAPG